MKGFAALRLFACIILGAQICMALGPTPRYDLVDSSDRGRKIAEKESLNFGAWADNTVGRLFLLYSTSMTHVCSYDFDQDFYAYEADAGAGRIVLSGTYYSVEKVVLKVFSVPPAWNTSDPMCSGFRQINETVVESFRDDILRVAVTKQGNVAVAMSTSTTVVMNLDDLTVVSFPHLFPELFYVRCITLESNFGVVAGYYRASAISFNVKMYLFNYTQTSIALGGTMAVTLFRPVNRPDKYFVAHEISIASNAQGLVLLGVPQSNFVIMADVSSGTFVQRGQRFGSLTSSGSQDVGYGKSVAWSSGMAIVLSQNNDPLHEIHFLTVQRAGNTPLLSSTTPIVFKYPNYQMTQPSFTGKRFTQLAASEHTLGALAENYHGILINATKPGWYWDTSYTVYPVAFARPCPAGTQKLNSGFGSCSFCGKDTYNNGSLLECSPCPEGSVCTGGSVKPMSPTIVQPISQTFKYYEGVADQFDDLILQFSLYIPKDSWCLVRRPAFWAYLTLILVPILLTAVVILRKSHTQEKRKKAKRLLKFLMDIDIVREGESYVGGMVTISVLVIIISSIVFSTSFIGRYPIEKVDVDQLQCGSQPNAKFDTSMEALSVPLPADLDYLVQNMRAQKFTLVFELLNTAATCSGVEVGLAKTESLIVGVPFNCSRTDDSRLVLKASISDLSSAHVIKVPSSVIASGARVGVQAPGADLVGPNGGLVNVSTLNFLEPFYKPGQVLERTPTFSMIMSVVVNATEPINDEPFIYSGLWIPEFNQDTSADSLFADEETFIENTQGYILARVEMAENYYFVQNYQSPIVRSGSMLFSLILWVLSVLDIYGLFIFLIKYFWKRVATAVSACFSKPVPRLIGNVEHLDEEHRWIEYEEIVKTVDGTPVSSTQVVLRRRIREHRHDEEPVAAPSSELKEIKDEAVVVKSPYTADPATVETLQETQDPLPPSKLDTPGVGGLLRISVSTPIGSQESDRSAASTARETEFQYPLGLPSPIGSATAAASPQSETPSERTSLFSYFTKH